jgi:hypothetical protein
MCGLQETRVRLFLVSLTVSECFVDIGKQWLSGEGINENECTDNCEYTCVVLAPAAA